ncbi:Cytosolic non-specific dipeptidase (CNDP dipeptidase 2) (Glutamate carboxypeptidase-like protein 1) [Durusdinium trenchii]|uniref:Cytosolic non-specific dipeptidase (CNDP dipeptidase 2) (Glutamate carboxypeptidase-like protein 1) n=1 Tax=Durusdinium trenchii TaxID=1381693 RepID=A0ABP0LJM0_9DINO
MSLTVTSAIAIPDWELTETFMRASGPGGQNVNKVETAVQLRFSAIASPSLPDAVKTRLKKIAGRRMTKDGEIIIEAKRYRSQERNREDARMRLAALIARAANPPRKRQKTREKLLTEDQAKRFVATLAAVEALGDSLEADGKIENLQIAQQPKAGELFKPYSTAVTALKTEYPADHAKLASAVKAHGFSTAEWGRVGDRVMIAYLAVKMQEEDPRSIEMMAGMDKSMMDMVPPEMRAQLESTFAMMETVKNAPEGDKKIDAGAEPTAAVQAAKTFHEQNGAEIVKTFVDLLAIPNDALDTENIRLNAETIADMFRERGFAMELLEHDGAPPLIYGLLETPGAERTVAIYVHYDGQPTEDAKWTHSPFEPVLYSRAMTDGGEVIPFPVPGDSINPDWRIYARSASDDKAPIPALLAAIDALQRANIPFTSNIKLIFDGEEERGSQHLDDYLAAYADKFSDIDLWLFCDGPSHQSGNPQLVFGVRGVTGLDVTVYGPDRGLHSGHYGNWAPGPGWRLASLLSSMKDSEGDVLIKDFYKSTQPVSQVDRAAIAAAPPIDEDLRATFGVARSEAQNAPLGERILQPALNLRGLKSAEVGAEARNVIPPSATASIGLRLVKGNDPSAMLDLVEAHIRREGYHIVRSEPDRETRLKHPLIAKVERDGGYPAVKSQMDDERVTPLISALRTVAGDELVLAPMLGGSLPLYMFEEASSAPIVVLPIANFDNNQHAPDENIRLGNLFYGVEAYAAVLTMDD